MTCIDEYKLEVCKSANGYYIGTMSDDSDMGFLMPNSRESVEYWSSYEDAKTALKENKWTQRLNY